MLSNFSLNDATTPTPVAHTFNKLRTGANEAVWRDNASTATEFREISLKTSAAGKGTAAGSTKRRTLAQLRHGKYNETTGKVETLVYNITMLSDLSGGFVQDDVDDDAAILKSFLGVSGIAASMVVGEL